MNPLPPGPAVSWPRLLYRYVYHPGALLEDCATRYGAVFTLRLGAVGTLVVVHRPADVKQVLSDASGALGTGTDLARPIVGNRSVFVLEGAEHLRRRRLLLPPFHGESVRGYESLIREATHAAIDRWQPGERFALHPVLLDITLEVILKAVFGLTESEELGSLRKAFLRLFKPMPAILSFLPQLQVEFRGSPFSRWLRLRTEVVRMLDEVITRRRQDAHLRTRRDVLSLLLSAKDEAGEGLGLEDIHDELITAVVAGHETTATALAWVFERIFTAGDLADRLRQELAQVPRDGNLASPSAAPLLDATIKETLRVRPPLPLVARRVLEPWTVAGYTLPPGVLVAPCLLLSQLNPEAYPDPTCFRPERWLEGASADPYLYYPFGGGTRRCVGMALALLELRVVVATVLERASLCPIKPGPAVARRRTITLLPEGGLVVQVKQVRSREVQLELGQGDG